MGIAIAHRKNRCDFGALRALRGCQEETSEMVRSVTGPLTGPRMAFSETPQRPQSLSEPLRHVAPIPVAPQTFSDLDLSALAMADRRPPAITARKTLNIIKLFCERPLGKSKRGLANKGLAQKAPIGPKKALSGEFLLPPCGCEVQRNQSQSAPKRPRRALKRLQSGPKRPDFPGRIFARFL